MSIASEISRLQTAKSDLATAIEGKGVTVPSATKLDGYADLVEQISGGGGEDTLVAWVDGTNYDLDLTGATTILQRFRYIQDGNTFTVNAPDATSIEHYAFRLTTKLASINAPNVTWIGDYCFEGNTFSSISLPKLKSTGNSGNCFRNCSALVGIVLPVFANILQSNMFESCTSLKYADLGSPTSLYGRSFYRASAFDTLIIRRTNSICGLNNINAFGSSPFASGGTGGTLYVPSALISDYQSATNWSTILGYSTNSIQAIEGSIYETQYADGTPIT